ncbi:MAG: Minf_1886 family protein [bacterium]
MIPLDPDDVRLLAIAERPPRYALGAYEFTRDAVGYASHVVFATGTHVTGPELCEAIRRLANERFGALAGDVLASWGIRRTEDFGDIVFRMIEGGFLSKTEDDRPEDFRDVYSIPATFTRTAYWQERFGDADGEAPPHHGSEPRSEASRP